MTPRRGGNLFPVGSHRYQIHNFHVKDGIPVLECWTFGDHNLPPSAHLVDMSCPSYVGCFEDGVGCARKCDTGLGHCSGPSLGPQVDHIMSSTLPFQYGVHRT